MCSTPWISGRKCFVSYVISCRFNFYQICQFCHTIVCFFSSLMYVTCFIMSIKTVFKLDCKWIWLKNAKNKNTSHWGAWIQQCKLLNDKLWFVKQSFTVPLCCSCNVWSGQPGWDGSSGCGYLLPAVDVLPKIVLFFLHVIFFCLYISDNGIVLGF